MLEIILLAIGVVCFIASYALTSDDVDPVAKSGKGKPVNVDLTAAQKEEIRSKVQAIINEEMGGMEDSTEMSLSKISNTKILEMNDYVQGVMNEINKNHQETVFMYDMLNDKSEQLKGMLYEIDQARNEIALTHGMIAENSEALQQLIKDSKKSVRDMDIAIKAAYKTKVNVLSQAEEVAQKAPDNLITPQFADNSAPMMEETYPEEEPEENNPYAIAANDTAQINFNEQILTMHEAGKSNLEIAKTLDIGMGEVKLVLDLFKNGKMGY
ncbi:MAG: hypothetical protein K6C69_07790 [Lachnospiraceae bacterium]|nr:hypothetical protein [Lachnospiraceae bacterium]